MNLPTASLKSRFGFALAWLLCLLACLPLGLARQVPEDKAAAILMAKVGDGEITDQALLRWLRNSFPDQATENSEQAKITLASYSPSFVKGGLDHLVNRRIVLEYLRANKIKVSPDEIALDLEKLANQLEQIDQTLDDYLKSEGITRVELESEFEWEIVWERYLTKVLTDEYLEQHYNRHRRRFDRSEMRVAHLLILTDRRSEAESMEMANQIYEKIKASKGSEMDQAWNAAVAAHSQAPSRESNGELGWIRFHEPMPESFSAAAFSLKVGEVSSPVVTKFGVHLIRCLELREGKTGWRDTATSVRDHAARTLFKRIAESHRPQVAISIR